MPQLGHILRRECPSWGTYCEKVPRVGQILRKKYREIHTRFCPTFSVGPAPPSKFCIRPCLRVSKGAQTHRFLPARRIITQAQVVRLAEPSQGCFRSHETDRRTSVFALDSSPTIPRYRARRGPGPSPVSLKPTGFDQACYRI